MRARAGGAGTIMRAGDGLVRHAAQRFLPFRGYVPVNTSAVPTTLNALESDQMCVYTEKKPTLYV